MQRKLLLGVLLATGVMGAVPAFGQVTGVVTKSSATTSLFLRSGKTVFDISSNYNGTDIGIESGYNGLRSGSTFSATSSLEPDYVSFKNGNVSGGLYSMTSSHTIVDITFTNDGTTSIRPKVISTIVPAGLGLFIDGTSCLDRLVGCAPATTILNPATFNDFLPSGLGSFGHELAGAFFDFKVTGGSSTLYDLAGGITLLRDPGTGQNVLVTDLAAASLALNGFTITSPVGSNQQFGAAWDETDFSVDFGLGDLLAPGESATVRYETTVTSFSQVDCVIVPADACLFAYSAFGDPIGRGGGVNPSFSAFLKSAAEPGSPGLIREFTPSEDDLLKFGSFKFERPVFKDGELHFELLRSAVPEPASWAMMICGFALAGMTLRVRSATHRIRVV
jgi:hypothetical protein